MSQPLPRCAIAARFEHSAVDMAAGRPILERSDLVLACACVLHTNGQSTHETVQAAERLGNELGLRHYSNANFDLLRATIADAMTAMAIILAMSFGVVAPKMIIDRFDGGSTPTRVVSCV